MDGQSQSPLPEYEWQLPYYEALLEVNEERLRRKVKVAEEKIHARLENLASDINNHGERQAIADALQALRILRKRCLELPDSQLG